MGVAEWVTLGTGAVTTFGTIAGVVRWAAVQFKAQARKLAEMEGRNATLYREHSLLLVRLERFRLAFQMVAAELARKSPGSLALQNAKAILSESFEIDPDLPSDLKSLLERLDDKEPTHAH